MKRLPPEHFGGSLLRCLCAFLFSVIAKNPVFDLRFIQSQRIGDLFASEPGFAHGDNLGLDGFDVCVFTLVHNQYQ